MGQEQLGSGHWQRSELLVLPFGGNYQWARA